MEWIFVALVAWTCVMLTITLVLEVLMFLRRLP